MVKNKISIPIYKPHLTPKSLSYAHEALDSTWISSQGKYIQILQEKLQELLNVKYILPLNNGTSACHLLAKSLFKKYNITKIIVPNNVYVAAWNAFLFDNNYTLFAVDADLFTWNIDLNKLDNIIKTHPDAAVLIVHNLGNIINVPQLQKKYPNTIFVEDNCEGLCGKYNNIYSGTASHASAISFYGNKNITCGEGGAFITNDEETYLFAKNTHAQGQSDEKFIHNMLGYNYRITNIQSAILLGQLEILNEILEMKSDIFNLYRAKLKDRQDIIIQINEENTNNANWMFGVRVPKKKYQQAEIYFQSHDIEIRPMFYPISAHSHLCNNKNVNWNDCTNAELLNQECFILPSYPDLLLHEQTHILKTLENYIKEK